MTKIIPSPEGLCKLLRYDDKAGKLFWRERTPDMFHGSCDKPPEKWCRYWNARYGNQEALKTDKGNGYLYGYVEGANVSAHRVIWAMVTGDWPSDVIDHIDGDTKNNRINNLREASHSENMCNRGKPINNTSGYKGVFWSNSEKKWLARIKSQKKLIYLGSFDTAIKAYEAYCSAAEKHHRQFANVDK